MACMVEFRFVDLESPVCGGAGSLRERGKRKGTEYKCTSQENLTTTLHADRKISGAVAERYERKGIPQFARPLHPSPSFPPSLSPSFSPMQRFPFHDGAPAHSFTHGSVFLHRDKNRVILCCWMRKGASTYDV